MGMTLLNFVFPEITPKAGGGAGTRASLLPGRTISSRLTFDRFIGIRALLDVGATRVLPRPLRPGRSSPDLRTPLATGQVLRI
jgi:hypothetical protein